MQYQQRHQATPQLTNKLSTKIVIICSIHVVMLCFVMFVGNVLYLRGRLSSSGADVAKYCAAHFFQVFCHIGTFSCNSQVTVQQ
jgi:hypothetical protein